MGHVGRAHHATSAVPIAPTVCVSQTHRSAYSDYRRHILQLQANALTGDTDTCVICIWDIRYWIFDSPAHRCGAHGTGLGEQGVKNTPTSTITPKSSWVGVELIPYHTLQLPAAAHMSYL